MHARAQNESGRWNKVQGQNTDRQGLGKIYISQILIQIQFRLPR